MQNIFLHLPNVKNSVDPLASLVAPVDVLLLEAEDDWPEVVVVGEVVPVLRTVKILLVRLVLHRSQPELAELRFIN